MNTNTLLGFVGGIVLAIAGVVGFSMTGGDSPPNVVIITPTAVAAPSPSTLACRTGWDEVQRGVTHVDGAAAGSIAEVGYISCDRADKTYSYTQVLGGSPRFMLFKTGQEVTEAEATR